MRRSILAVILLLAAGLGAYGQNSPAADVVLLLDTSSGMGSSYERVNDYITGAFLSEFLRIGDTFHLIFYSGRQRLDVARRIQGRGDVETILGRMLLQYPIESGSDAGAAIRFTEEYIAALPSRPKKIVMVGTGGSDINNIVGAARQRLISKNTTLDFVLVTPGQPLANLPSSGRTPAARPSTQAQRPPAQQPPPPARQTTPAASQPATGQAPSTSQPAPAVGQQATGQQSAGTTAPPSTTTGQTPSAPSPSTAAGQTPPAPSQPAAQPQPSSPTAAPTPSVTTPSGAAQPPAAGTAVPPGSPSEATGVSSRPPSAAVETGGQETQPSITDSSPAETGESSPATGSAAPRDTPRDRPVSPAVSEKPKASGESWTSSMPLIIGIIVLAVLALGLAIFFALRRLGSSPNRVMASVSAHEEKDDLPAFVDHSKDLAKYAAVQSRQRTTPYADRPVKPEISKPAVINPAGPLLLNLYVEDQNTAIGKRNIHSLKSGYSLSVGGGKSDFLIFLVSIPPNIGEIRRDGSQCSFIPRKPKYFPDLGSNELRDCIHKTIRIVSDKNYEIRFRFEMYEDPLIALNRVLMSVKVPG